MCHKLYSECHHLNSHVKMVHERLRPHKGNQCPKEFYEKAKLKTHVQQVHLGLATVSCKICDDKFKSTRTLNTHLHRVHNLETFLDYLLGTCWDTWSAMYSGSVHILKDSNFSISAAFFQAKLRAILTSNSQDRFGGSAFALNQFTLELETFF